MLFHSRKWIWKCLLQNGSHFVSASMCQPTRGPLNIKCRLLSIGIPIIHLYNGNPITRQIAFILRRLQGLLFAAWWVIWPSDLVKPKPARFGFWSGAISIKTERRLVAVLSMRQSNFRAIPWWRHQMETCSALLAISPGNSPVTGEFSAQRPVTRGFDVFFDLCQNKRLSKQ